MESIFQGENILEFIKMFPDDQSCLEFIANEKWKDGYNANVATCNFILINLKD